MSYTATEAHATVAAQLPSPPPPESPSNAGQGSVVGKMLKSVASLRPSSAKMSRANTATRRHSNADVDNDSKEKYEAATGTKGRRLSQIGFQEISPDDLVIGDKLGEGALGVVHEGTHKGVPVAIKSFKGRAGEFVVDRNSDFGRDLVAELDVLFAVGFHPSVVGFYGAVTLSKPMLILELVKGPSLDEYLHGSGSSTGDLHTEPHINTVAGWTRDLLSGVNYMHDRDPCIIHRDLKPANLILTADLGKLKILDFGVGKMVNRKERLTRQMTSCTGTNRYMAPEVYFSDGNYTEKADIYSCALIIWEITSGRRPFDLQGETFNLQQQSTREVMRPNTISMSQWPDLAPLVEKAWAPKPEERPSAKEMLVLLAATPNCPAEGTEASPLMYLDGDFLNSPQCLCVVM